MRKILLSGQKFGRLLVLHEDESKAYKEPHWVCKCDCGNTKSLPSFRIRKGITKSCGCLASETCAMRGYRHGGFGTVEYASWNAMLSRCYNNKVDSYKHYGGRGIVVCEEWLKFENFIRDMGKKPRKNYSIDRIDVDGNYEKSNCRWATPKVQSRNKRNNRWVELNGERLVLSDWAVRVGIKVDTLWRRLKYGWSEEKTLTTPVK